MTLHRGVHPNLDVEDCFGCRIASVSIAPSATPSRNGGNRVVEQNQMEKRWTVDHAAYRRLVKNGLQPKTLDGAAHLEREATHAAEIEHGIGAPADLYDHFPKDAA